MILLIFYMKNDCFAKNNKKLMELALKNRFNKKKKKTKQL